MSIEDNKATVRRVYDLCMQKDLAALFELCDPGYIEHTAAQQQLREYEVKEAS